MPHAGRSGPSVALPRPLNHRVAISNPRLIAFDSARVPVCPHSKESTRTGPKISSSTRSLYPWRCSTKPAVPSSPPTHAPASAPPAEKSHSKPIAHRVRRPHQRLPPARVIETASATPSAVPINDSALWVAIRFSKSQNLRRRARSPARVCLLAAASIRKEVRHEKEFQLPSFDPRESQPSVVGRQSSMQFLRLQAGQDLGWFSARYEDLVALPVGAEVQRPPGDHPTPE